MPTCQQNFYSYAPKLLQEIGGQLKRIADSLEARNAEEKPEFAPGEEDRV